jgi:hypothetical protein
LTNQCGCPMVAFLVLAAIVPGWRRCTPAGACWSLPSASWRRCSVTVPAICLRSDQPLCEVTGQDLHSRTSHDLRDCLHVSKDKACHLPHSQIPHHTTSSSTKHSTSLAFLLPPQHLIQHRPSNLCSPTHHHHHNEAIHDPPRRRRWRCHRPIPWFLRSTFCSFQPRLMLMLLLMQTVLTSFSKCVSTT